MNHLFKDLLEQTFRGYLASSLLLPMRRVGKKAQKREPHKNIELVSSPGNWALRDQRSRVRIFYYSLSIEQCP